MPTARQQPLAVVLIGFMGAGKSTVGLALGRRMGWAFEDLDLRIESRERRKVHEIFRDSGESRFRQLEHAALRDVLRELHPGSERVIALGGGAFAQTDNAKLLEEADIPTVFLDAEIEELWRRCRGQADEEGLERPLLGSLVAFRELYQARQPYYLKASFRQETGRKSVDKITAEVIKSLGLNKSRRRQGEKK